MSGQPTRRRVARQLGEAIELVVLGVRAGATPTAAIRITATHSPEPLAAVLADVIHRVERGERLADALDALRSAAGPAADAFVDGFASAERYGLPLEPVLDRLALEVRDDRRRLAERAARVLPVRLAFPLVTCTLPSFVLIAIAPGVLGAISTLGGSTP